MKRILFFAAALSLLGCSREVKRPKLEMPLINAIAEHTTYKAIQNMPSIYIVSVRSGSLWRIESRTFDGSRAQVLVCDGKRVRAMNSALIKKKPGLDYINGRFELLGQIYSELDQFKFGGLVKLDGQKCWAFQAETGAVMHFNKRSGYLCRMETQTMLTTYHPVPPKMFADTSLFATDVAPKPVLLPKLFKVSTP